MTEKTTKKAHPCAVILRERKEALEAVLGPERIKAFMANVFAQLSPTNAAGKPNKLLQCSPGSFFAACHQAATLGLQPGPLDEVYLVPYGKKAGLIIGYKGMLELARRHSDILKITAKCVYAGDEFGHDEATGQIHHSSNWEVDKTDDNIVGAYCRAVVRNCEEPISLVMNKAQIEMRRNRSAAKNGNFWRDDYAAMARKTVIRAHFNGGELPRSTALAAAIQYEVEEEKRAEVLSVRTEEPETQHAAMEIGFDTEAPEPDAFGLGAPERAKPSTGDKKVMISDILAQGKRLKWSDESVRKFAGDVLGSPDDHPLTSHSVRELQDVLGEMEVQK
jgi:phage RecT family recombinase